MDWLERTTRLRQWTRNGTRAPHKPLLLLYALGRFQEDADSELRYSAVEEDLQRLLTEYGPPNKTSPAYPFLHERLRCTARERSGRNAEPSAAIIDSQSVDASETVGEDSRGYDSGKSRDGRKRHILTDTEGLLLEVTVTTADVHDSKAAPALLETFMDQPGRLLKLVWVDSAYQGPALAKAFARHGVRIEVVRRCDGQRGFVVLARRWVVERTLSWLSRSRRLNRDHERRPDHHAQMVWWAAVIRLSRRLAADAPRWPEKRPARLLRARA